MIILGQTLPDTEQKRVLKEARKYANDLHLSDTKYPRYGCSSHRSGWDYNNSAEKWERAILCVKVGFKASWQKAINYSKVSAICQGLDENLTAFLERLREALIKHTNSDLDSYEGQIILKDKFLTQSASDIR